MLGFFISTLFHEMFVTFVCFVHLIHLNVLIFLNLIHSNVLIFLKKHIPLYIQYIIFYKKT